MWNNTAGSGNPVVHSKFLYDGWNLCAEIDGLNPQPRTLILSYVWGTDLSGSLQGAGGVGGLLKFIYHATQSTNFVTYDGNGNVAALFDASNNTLIASYEYGLFGELIRATGPTVGSMAKLNPIRFSTKYHDDESEFVYYGYRYYSASTGRWISRDPIEEQGGVNLYCFAANIPINRIDPTGLQTIPPPWGELLNRAYLLCRCRRMVLDKTKEAEDWANENYGVIGGTHNTEALLLTCSRIASLRVNSPGTRQFVSLPATLCASGGRSESTRKNEEATRWIMRIIGLGLRLLTALTWIAVQVVCRLWPRGGFGQWTKHPPVELTPSDRLKSDETHHRKAYGSCSDDYSSWSAG